MPPVAVHVPTIGQVIFKRNLRARRLTIRVKPEGIVSVTYPGYVSKVAALHFVQSKSDWIRAKLDQQKTIGLLANETGYRTRQHLLVLSPEQRANIMVKVSQGKILVRYPHLLPISDNLVQQAAKRGIDLAYRLEAHQHLPGRVRELAQKFGFTYGKLSIRRTYSRWGSCSATQNISLSIYLMKLPNHLIDYIIIHELVHTKVPNHQKEFWNLLDQLVDGRAKLLVKELKEYRTGL